MLFALLVFSFTVHAEIFLVQFGHEFGMSYSPDRLPVAVGDTIQWVGPFETHPMSSTEIPDSAGSFHVTSGSEFMYPVLFAGTYFYRCDAHYSQGMTGSFTAVPAAAVGEVKNGSARPSKTLTAAYRKHTESIEVGYTTPAYGSVVVSLCDGAGKVVQSITMKHVRPGTYWAAFKAGTLSPGIYFCRLKARDLEETKKLAVIR